ncbi:M28 family peptidase [candidate division CSSED10-310 bacterium]|uniref:M28 family peptidase n=1 Tax=candidate division CSSED10-310 bacterium TaxID=2855610 RepID=A0ABV6Z5B1_UNCC1
MTTMKHIQHLAQTIGSRGSATPKESEASRYVEQVLRDIGLEPVIETFISAVSAWYPYVVFTGLMLLSECLFWFGGRLGSRAALTIAVVALGSVLLELIFRPNPIRWLLPKQSSQNVWARIPPKDQVRQQVVLLGHLDTHRTPLAFSSQKWLSLFQALVPIGMIASVILIGLFVLGVWFPAEWTRWLSLPITIVVFGLFALTLQADVTPYSAGANDNASGVAMALSIAEKLKDEPLAHTSLWVVLTGCEEVGCYGAEAFARAHKHELEDVIWLTLDTLGSTSADPTYITKETFLLTTHSDPDLLLLADQIAHDHPELKIKSDSLKGAYYEGCIGRKYGFRVFTLSALPMSEWHQPTDTYENVDAEVIEKNETFLWQFLQSLDQQIMKEF